MRGRFSTLDALLRSSAFSVGASVFNYVVILALARSLGQDDMSHYLYVVAWGMAAVLIVDCAAEQCLLHFSRVQEVEPISVWFRLVRLKLFVLAIVSVAGMGLSSFGIFRFPVEFLLFVVPAFYLGPIFEAKSRNVDFAKIMFVEKLGFLVLAGTVVGFGWPLSWIFVSYALASVVSLLVQFKVSGVDLRSAKLTRIELKTYAGAYVLVYLVLIAQLFYGSVSRLIIDSKLGALAFGAATLSLQMINLISLVQTQVDKHVRPKLIASAVGRDGPAILEYAKNYFFYYLVPLAILATFASIFAAPLMGLVFGERWKDAGQALRVLSPLLVTIACLRLLDILVVTLNLTRWNLLVNVMAASLLTILLVFMPEGRALADYLLAIVIVQALHVGSMGWLVFSEIKRM